MNRMLQLLTLIVVPLFALAASAGVDQSTAQPVTIEYYYRLAPGGTSEWLALYKKNHNPLLKELMKEGLLKSEKLYTRRFHAESPAWDYKIVMGGPRRSAHPRAGNSQVPLSQQGRS